MPNDSKQSASERIATRIKDLVSRANEQLKSSGETELTRNFIEPFGDVDYEITLKIKAVRT